jgi:hypothetical protein
MRSSEQLLQLMPADVGHTVTTAAAAAIEMDAVQQLAMHATCRLLFQAAAKQ